MKRRIRSRYMSMVALSALAGSLSAHAAPKAPVSSPTGLRCESLVQPLGMGEKQPMLSWELRDGHIGARQTAYEIQVASSARLLSAGKGDVWDSGKVASDRSAGVSYAGPELTSEKRYYWRVKVWDKDGRPYPVSNASWWETGLLDAKDWRGQWIGYEDPEHHSVREAHATWITNPAVPAYKGTADTHHQFRLSFELPQSATLGVLYVTGEETAAAWVNGKQVLETEPAPPWGRPPWRTYKRIEVTPEVHAGKNLLAIEVTTYDRKDRSETPMNAALYVEFADGTHKVLRTGGKGWKSAFNATGEWYSAGFEDAAWEAAIAYPPGKDAFGGPDEMGSPLQTGPVTLLRHDFKIEKPVASARLYATAMGAYKFHLNGNVVGDEILAPGWMDFREHVPYQVFDVTSLLSRGENAMGAYLAAGWYSTPLEWIGQGNNYGSTPPALKAQLRIEHTDGSIEWIATDDSWKADDSPIASAEIYNGETFDARRIQQGWDTASFSDAKWAAAESIHPKEPEILWQSFQPIRATNTLPAKSVTTIKPGVYVYDFGQEIAGLTRIRVSGPAGTDVKLRFAEVLNGDGSIYIANLRNAKATDHYILDGKGVETYEPSFTFHGFRYVEISGLAQKPALDAVQAIAVHTDAPITAQLKTGSEMVNKLWSNILWGQRSNFVGVPTDCPQRDERLGWTADAQVFWRTATYNMDLTAFSRKYAGDLRGTQLTTPMYGIYAPGTAKTNPGYATGWSDAGVIVPWTSWMQNGDASIVEQNWSGMEKYLAAIASANPDYLWLHKSGIGFGDWLAPEGTTSQGLIATAYWAYDVSLMEQMAHATGRSEDERKYAELFEKIKAAFQKTYVKPDGFVGGVRAPEGGDEAKKDTAPVETQTGYVLALHMKLLPEETRPLAAKRLVDRIAENGGKLGTGFLGTPYLLEVLTDTGHADVAYELLLNTKYPSWGYMVEHGATTMWERWNGDQMRADPGMNSYNHYAYGAVAEWIYRYAAGIDTLASDPGFHTISLHPSFSARLGSVNFSYQTPYGLARSAWTVSANKVVWKVTIPPNTTALLPISMLSAANSTINGKPVGESANLKKASTTGAESDYQLLPGSYTFATTIP